MTGPFFAMRAGLKNFTLYGNRFDPHTGLSFRETTIAARKQPRLLCTPQVCPLTRTESKGATTLQTAVLNKIFCNLDGITSESLAGLPWQCARLIWDTAVLRDSITLDLWKAFATAYFDEPTVGYYVAIDPRPRDGLDNYRISLSSQKLEWLTCLTLANVCFSRAELVNLSLLHNLVALDVQRSDNTHIEDPSVDDGIIKNWARRAQETEGFPKLYCLILRNQPCVTMHSLQHLNLFPSLALFGVVGCALDHKDESRANSVGWTSQDQDDSFRKLQRDIELSYSRDEPILSTFRHSRKISNTLSNDPSSHSSFDKTPILNFRIGTLSTGFLLSEALVFFRTINSLDTQRQAQNPTACVSKRNDASQADDHAKMRKKLHIRASKQVDLSAYLNNESQEFMVEVQHRPKIE